MENKKLLVHLHLYYFEQLNYFLDKLKNINCNYDLFVTAVGNNPPVFAKLKEFKSDVNIRIVKNIGYDIIPFIEVIKSVNIDDYDYVLKLHSKNKRKKNVKLPGCRYLNIDFKNYNWRNMLVDSLIKNESVFNENLKILDTGEFGFICSDELLLDLSFRTGLEDTVLLDELKNRLNINNDYRYFCAGTMFLIKPTILKRLINSDITSDEFEETSTQTGGFGTKIYALERIFAILAVDEGYKIYTRNNLDSNNEKPKFSVIMPTYNRAFCIEDAVNSLINQTYTDWELIIIDDGSTDNTKDLIQTKYKDLIEQKKLTYKYIKKSGVCKARNIALDLAKNNWIAYLDTDNKMCPDYLMEFSNAIIKNGNKCFYSKFKKLNGKIIGHMFNFNELNKKNYIDCGVFVHNIDLVKKYGNFNKKYTYLEDWELILRYTKNNIPYFIDKVLLEYNDSNTYQRITNTHKSKRIKKSIQRKFNTDNLRKKIISLREEDNHKVLNFLGLRFKFKTN